VAQQRGPLFSTAAIDALRHTSGFEKWNRDFEDLRRAIGRRISPRDIQPLLKAGAKEEKLLTLLAFVVCGPDGLSWEYMARRKSLARLAAQLVSVTKQATLLVNDPLCDGRFWWALEAGLSWDLVPKFGVIEAPTLKKMQALARLIEDRGNAFGEHSRPLKKIVRNAGIRDLIAYICMSTKGNFDAEIAYLLEAAYRAADPKIYKLVVKSSKRGRHFTADQIKKVRQRHLTLAPSTKSKSQVTSEPISVASKLRAAKSFGQRIADVG
jgi:hypothetical protein